MMSYLFDDPTFDGHFERMNAHCNQKMLCITFLSVFDFFYHHYMLSITENDTFIAM